MIMRFPKMRKQRFLDKWVCSGLLLVCGVLLVISDLKMPFLDASLYISETQDITDNHAHVRKSPGRLGQIANQALQFVLGRKRAFEEEGLVWQFRGLGYLYTRHNMILAATVPSTMISTGESHSVHIYDVHPENTARSDCHNFTIWVRVEGPEIVAGRAKPVDANFHEGSSSCYWTFDFKLNRDGEYRVEAKILGYATQNRTIPARHLDQCERKLNITKPEELASIFPVHSGFRAFKFYYPIQVCCEICARLSPHCLYWATPTFQLEHPSYGTNGCELFFREGTPEEMIPRSRLIGQGNRTVMWNASISEGKPRFQFGHGFPHDDLPAHNFLGCSWSNWHTLEFPCVSGELDDKVFMAFNSFKVHKPSDSAALLSRSNLPLCSPDMERIGKSNGRWVRESWPNATACPREMAVDKNYTKFAIMEHDPDHPHCWHRDSLLEIGKRCIELNCRFIPEFSQSRSSLKNTTKWYGVWRHDSCDYFEFTNKQLQECVSKRKIGKFEGRGISINQFLSEYVGQRTKFLNFYEGEDAVTVILDTLGLVHKVLDPEAKIRRHFEKMKNNTDSKTVEHYIVTGPFVTSEREVCVYADFVDQLNQLVQELLAGKGYRFLDFFDSSAAFSYDTATQMDGLHVIGPPMKMVITKLFHYVCKDVVQGSIL